MQTYQTEENQIYSENYRSTEYNEIQVSQEASEYCVAPDNDVENNTSLKSSSSKETNSLISGTLLTSSGILAGVTVIVSAIVAMVLLKINVIAAIVAPCSLDIKLSIQSGKDLELSAYLTGNGEEYVVPLDYSEGDCDVSFEFLTPDTEYYFAVKDVDGNTYFSEIYRTEQYEELISAKEINSFGEGIYISFDALKIAENKEYEVYVGTLLLDARLTKDNPVASFEDLLPNTEYVIRVIDPEDGSVAYYAELSTGNSIESAICYSNAQEIVLSIADEYISKCGYPLEVYFDGKLTSQKIDASNNFSELDANTDYLLVIVREKDGAYIFQGTYSTTE